LALQCSTWNPARSPQQAPRERPAQPRIGGALGRSSGRGRLFRARDGRTRRRKDGLGAG
jgi:hypothetical protein